MFYFQISQKRARLQLEYELHSKITSATLKLSRERRTNRSIRRQRKECHKQMKAKVRIQELIKFRVIDISLKTAVLYIRKILLIADP